MPQYIPPQAPKPGPRDFHLPGRQPFARANQRRNHEEALLGFGEMSMFVLMWTIQDHEAGRVGRCPRCTQGGATGGTHAEAIFDTFQQPAENRCPACHGTTYEGGWKAKLIRPAIWDYSEERWDRSARGMVSNLTGQVQSTSDFRLTDRDWIFRGDGTRWRASGATTTRIRDGFGLPSRADSNLGYNYSQVTKEDSEAIAFEIEPKTKTELQALLDSVGEHFPPERLDQIRGPVLLEINEHTPKDYRVIDNLPGRPHPRSAP